jgi:hypothetical protein
MIFIEKCRFFDAEMQKYFVLKKVDLINKKGK